MKSVHKNRQENRLPSSEIAQKAKFCDKCDDLLEGSMYCCKKCGKNFHYDCVLHDITGLLCPVCSGKLKKVL